MILWTGAEEDRAEDGRNRTGCEPGPHTETHPSLCGAPVLQSWGKALRERVRQRALGLIREDGSGEAERRTTEHREIPQPDLPAPTNIKGRTPTAFSNGLRAGDGGKNALDTYDYRIRPIRALQHQRVPKVPMPDGSLPANPLRRIGALLLDGLALAVLMAMLWLGWLWVCALD